MSWLPLLPWKQRLPPVACALHCRCHRCHLNPPVRHLRHLRSVSYLLLPKLQICTKLTIPTYLHTYITIHFKLYLSSHLNLPNLPETTLEVGMLPTSVGCTNQITYQPTYIPAYAPRPTYLPNYLVTLGRQLFRPTLWQWIWKQSLLLQVIAAPCCFR